MIRITNDDVVNSFARFVAVAAVGDVPIGLSPGEATVTANIASMDRNDHQRPARRKLSNSKSHTTTINRIARRYSGRINPIEGPDIRTHDMIIEVETQATLHHGVRSLKAFEGPVYLAVTNMEALPDALRVTHGTPIGVMDPKGDILKVSSATNLNVRDGREHRT